MIHFKFKNKYNNCFLNFDRYEPLFIPLNSYYLLAVTMRCMFSQDSIVGDQL